MHLWGNQSRMGEEGGEPSAAKDGHARMARVPTTVISVNPGVEVMA